MSKEVAQTILQQLGGNKFAAMTGAKNFVGGENALSFFIGKNSKSINRVFIQYDTGNDLYNMVFQRYRKLESKVIRSFEGVYASDLQRLFTLATGMNTHP